MSTTYYVTAGVITVQGPNDVYDVLGVQNGRVSFLGSQAEAEERIARDGGVLDLTYRENVFIPGFVEAHGHMFASGVTQQYLWLGFDDRPRADGSVDPGCRSIPEVLDRLRAELSSAHDPTTGVFGYGFDPSFHDGAPLTRSLLDEVSTDVPVRVMNASLHLGYVNSAHLRTIDEVALTSDPGIHRDEQGVPNGIFSETGLALAFGPGLFAAPDPHRAVRDGANLARRVGVTTHSELAQFTAGPAFSIYETIARTGTLPVRVAYSPFLGEMDRRASEQDLLAQLAELRGRDDDHFFMGPLKWITDGSIQGFTAALSWPGYCSGEDHGRLLMSSDDVAKRLLPFHAAGYQLALHANGDAAIDAAVDGYASLLREHPRTDHRHRIEHCQMATERALTRMAELSLAVNFFSNHLYYWGDVHATKTMGLERAERSNPAKSALRHGLRISLHSDTPVTAVDPITTMWCARERTTRTGRVLGADERLTPYEALRAVTLGGAELLHREDVIGSLSIGKFADVTVLSHNPLNVTNDALRSVRVVTTLLGGTATA